MPSATQDSTINQFSSFPFKIKTTASCRFKTWFHVFNVNNLTIDQFFKLSDCFVVVAMATQSGDNDTQWKNDI